MRRSDTCGRWGFSGDMKHTKNWDWEWLRAGAHAAAPCADEDNFSLHLRWQSGFCEEGRSSNASQFARDADADAAAGTTAAAGRAAAPASGRIEPARREGADLTRPTGRPRRRAHVALSKPSATPLRLPSRRLPCSLVAQAIDS